MDKDKKNIYSIKIEKERLEQRKKQLEQREVLEQLSSGKPSLIEAVKGLNEIVTSLNSEVIALSDQVGRLISLLEHERDRTSSLMGLVDDIQMDLLNHDIETGAYKTNEFVED